MQNADLLAGIEPLRDELADTLAQAKDAKVVQENLTGERQLATQRFTVLVDTGSEQARKVRGFIISRLGSRSEKLPQFGITPNRSRKIKRTGPETPPTDPGPEVEIANPGEAPLVIPTEEAKPQ